MKYRGANSAVAPEAWPFALPAAAAALLATILRLPWLALAITACFGSILFFFRNPRRATPLAPNLVIAPADGTVVAAGIAPHPEFEDGQALRVAIFMSLFNVHMNWAPFDGELTDARHIPGKFINAMHDKAAEENERVLLTLRTPYGALIGVKLVAGLVARRIVCPLEPGDKVARGEKTGLIRFGSRVEVWLPASSRLCVAPGMKTRGGETVIAHMAGINDHAGDGA
ncbi:MAG: phosphatidylserine decarboxylase [bacterium]